MKIVLMHYKEEILKYKPVVLIILFLVSTAHAKSFGDFEGGLYVRNYDGDTITINLTSLHHIIDEKISI